MVEIYRSSLQADPLHDIGGATAEMTPVVSTLKGRPIYTALVYVAQVHVYGQVDADGQGHSRC